MSDAAASHVLRLIAELPARTAGSELVSSTRSAMQTMVDSLDIPTRVEVNVHSGPARLIVGDVALRLSEVATEPLGFRLDDLWSYADRLVTDDVAQSLWLQWHAAQAERVAEPGFLQAFRDMLAEGVSLGFRLGRFREISRHLPPPDRGRRNWASLFEEAVSAPDSVACRVYLSREHYQRFLGPTRTGNEEGTTWEHKLTMMADGLFYELGIVFPPLSVHIDDSLPAPWFRCEWNDLRLPSQCGLETNHFLVNDTVDRLRLLNVQGEAAEHPANGSECAVIEQRFVPVCEQAGLTVWDAPGYLILTISTAIRRAAAAFVNRALLDLYLLRLREFNRDLVSVVQDSIDKDTLVRILRGLLSEEISIRDMGLVLNAVVSLQGTCTDDLSKYIIFANRSVGTYCTHDGRGLQELTPEDYVEFVRWHLKRYISHKYTRGQNTLIVYLLEPQTEDRLAHASALSAAEREILLEAVRLEVGSLPPTAQNPVLLTTSNVRRRLRKELYPEFRHLAVLSYQELSPDMNIQPIARISPEPPDLTTDSA
jgi:hypothetical protein